MVLLGSCARVALITLTFAFVRKLGAVRAYGQYSTNALTWEYFDVAVGPSAARVARS